MHLARAKGQHGDLRPHGGGRCAKHIVDAAGRSGLPLHAAIGFIQRPAGIVAGGEIDHIAKDCRGPRSGAVDILRPARAATVDIQRRDRPEAERDIDCVAIDGQAAARRIPLPVALRRQVTGP